MMSGLENAKLEDETPKDNIEPGKNKATSNSPRFLPPICNNGELNRAMNEKPKRIADSKTWSDYHKVCFVQDFGQTPVRPARRTQKSPRTKGREAMSVMQYLENNKEFLEAYVVDSIPVEELEQWLLKKTRNLKSNEQWNTNKMTNCKQKFMTLIRKLQEVGDEHSVINEIAYFVSNTVGADAYRVFKLYPDHMNFVQYFTNSAPGVHTKDSSNLERAGPEEVELVLKVARRGATWRLSKNDIDIFPDSPKELRQKFGIDEAQGLNHVLYQPILNAAGKTVYVIEMWRSNNQFDKRDEEMSTNFVIWNSLTLHYCNLYLDKTRERNMADFLLEVVKAIFEEMVSLDQLIKRILEFAQRLVNADRASLFLVDYRNSELVSTVFDLQFEAGHERDMEKKKIRMPINRGIAGHVAQSGETMNIPDAYSDYRFNRDVDEVTGYKTSSILCMPVKVEGKVIGVVQMVNKRNSNYFDHEDEVAFEMFSTVFGLALHHAKLYDKIMRKEQKYRVTLEILSYHNTCRENEVQEILNSNLKVNINMDDFYLDPYKIDDFQKCKAVLAMFDDLFGLSNFDKTSVTRFVLTVRKNYRRVPYHNFDHGWSVAHSMYVMLKNDKNKRFDYKMRLALFVACLCHDLDHRGYTNQYLNETASPLAAMYTTSPLEHHHFNITVKILQQEGHYIFSHLSSEDYKDILRYIKYCILATDLVQFFTNLKKMKDIVYSGDSRSKGFDWAATEHRNLAMAISMTAADLSASAKPWDVQIKTVKVIFEEFYEQGDKERAAGKTPIADMMDRNKPEEQPPSQVGFLSQICVPCYEILHQILPSTEPMYKMVLKNLSNWKSLANSRNNRTPSDPPSLNDDTLKSVSDSELDHDTIEDRSDIPIDKNVVVEDSGAAASKDDDKIKRTLQSMRSDSASWDEEQIDKASRASEIWKVVPTEDFLADDEGLVIGQHSFRL
ncbi:probable 3',5'-cyclic phosphodiesterase pde-5 isoform X1 [Colias croceus]|uniref:probable 3',5'-cyclic phosphodiesterase pde-5 isoform X1 n=2 Tax=Colias crocea TaxID=72248 RepID=UPI001E27B7A1|nr:probable 3',5'-cyclic phosphodiesterase pde-5 isoform X1 [Colias croceus]XP_045509925.1 probable 3',5'-cyclic phosphodiesterase pde-5 isoform X1 [Colias croceus]